MGEILTTSSLKVYSFSDMKSATKSLKSDTMLGVGGFGTVYKVWVDENTLEPCKGGTGMVVAVKKQNHESVQGFQEWKVRVAAVLTNTPYILNLDCDHYVNNRKAIHEAMFFLMDLQVGRDVCYLQFP